MIELSQFKTLKVELENSAATVTLNRPEVRNAFHPSMISELTEVFRELTNRAGGAGRASAAVASPDDGEIRAVILRGAGKSFCSGADLGHMQSMASFTLEQNKQDADQLFEMFWAIRNCPYPIVGLVHGHVMGGALGLLALCDIAAAVDGTQFCFSEVKLGLAPAVISPFVLEKMNASHARRYLLTGEIFSSQVARESGLVQFSGDWTQVESFVSGIAKALGQNGAGAVRATKSLILGVMDSPGWSERRKLTTESIASRRVSEEGQEGLKSFFEKRAPAWRLD